MLGNDTQPDGTANLAQMPPHAKIHMVVRTRVVHEFHECVFSIGGKRMVAGQKVGVLSSTIHPYPTQAEVLRKVGDAYMRQRLTPTVKKIFEKWLAWRR